MNAFSRSGAVGILYAEDFSDPPPRQPGHQPARPPAEPPVPPPLSQADIDAACIQAVQAAERAWAESAAERRALALETIAAQLSGALDLARQQTEALADGLARTLLGMVAAALPELCRRHGDAEVRALLRHILPLAGRSSGVVVRVHAGLIETLTADLAQLDDNLAGAVQLRAANLAPGDVRLGWEDGGLVRDTTAIQGAVQDCLLQLGLLDPVTEPPQHANPDPRSLALAH